MIILCFFTVVPYLLLCVIVMSGFYLLSSIFLLGTVSETCQLSDKKSKLLRDVKSSDTVLCQDSLMTVFYCLGVIESEA